MIPFFFQMVEEGLGGAIGPGARFFHAAVAVVLAAAWARPLADAVRAVRRPVRWSPTWACPRCGSVQPESLLFCPSCRGEAAPAPPVRAFRPVRRAAGLVARGAGGAVFYFSTAVLAHRLRFFLFQRPPVEEMLAALSMALWLTTLFWVHRALTRRGETFFGRLARLMTAGVVGVFFLGATVLWAAAPPPPEGPLIAVSVTPDGVLRLADRPRRKIGLALRPGAGTVIAPVRSARVVWPVMGIDRTVVMTISTLRVAGRGAFTLLRWLEPRCAAAGLQGLRVTSTPQTLDLAPPGFYEIHRGSDGKLRVKKVLP